MNESERRVLALLATGHTAKSIAKELGLSVNAVNERLREARRKTGAASSRELARSLAIQENWHKQIGMAGLMPATAGPALPGADGRHRVSPKGLLLMSSIAIAMIIAATSHQQTGPAQPLPRSPVLSKAMLDRVVASTSDLNKTMLEEGRDGAWADAAQARLAALYRTVSDAPPSTITCWRTMCEVCFQGPDAEARARAAIGDAPFVARVVAAGFGSDPTLQTRVDRDHVEASIVWSRARA